MTGRSRAGAWAQGRPASGALALLALLLVAVPTPASADDPPEAARAPVEEAGPERRRDPAWYRGRAPERDEVGEVFLWIPRILLAPLTLVSEMILRRPLLAALTWMEENDVLDAIDYVLNPHPDVSWSPTLSFEAGVLALPGARVEWRNALTEGHDFELHVAVASSDFWSVELEDRWRIGPATLGLRGGSHRRPERPFYGLGPASPSVRTYFAESRTHLEAYGGLRHGNHARADLTVGYSLEDWGAGIAPSIETIVDLNELPGFGRHELGLLTIDLLVDSRADPEEGGGVRLRGDATFGMDRLDPNRSFMTVELDLEGGFEVSAPDRVLVGRLYFASTVPFGDAPVPFGRLAWLGWDRHRGFVRGRFRGEAAVLAELRYRYPVNFNVDMQWLASVGNVFARDLSDFEIGALTASFGVGFRTRRTGLGAPMELSVALGSSRFDATRFEIVGARFFFETVYGP